jgi:UDP-2,3-diacylglucosamine pyrophosphatase LpxH
MSKLANLVLHIQAALEERPLVKEGLVEIPPQKETAKEPAKKHDPTKKELVLEAILRRSHEVQIEDLPQVEEELQAFFEEFKNGDYFNDFKSEDYYRLIDLREQPDTRVVVVGDIHCDYKSLAALLIKVSVSPYDFFEKGLFVFMGDYLDRGAMLFEPLLLLMDLKRILGDRMIMLRGNHELISYNKESQLMEGRVVPQDSVPCLNEYCGENKAFLEAFGHFYQTLPTYVYLKVKDQNVLLTHGGVPRQIFLDVFRFEQETGAIAFERNFLYEQDKLVEKDVKDDSLKTKTTMLNSNLLLVRNRILYDMIWGDPAEDEEKYQTSGRFQFGSKQFEAYAQKNKLSRLFRSHEPVEFGFKSFFNNKLFTIFSTGGSENDQAGYADVQPAFAIVDADGSYEIENSYIYRVIFSGVIDMLIDLYSENIIRILNIGKYALNDEFCCSAQDALNIREFFAKINEAFSLEEDTEDKGEEEAKADTPKEEATVDSGKKEQETEVPKESSGEHSSDTADTHSSEDK